MAAKRRSPSPGGRLPAAAAAPAAAPLRPLPLAAIVFGGLALVGALLFARARSAPGGHPVFDGRRAFQDLEKQVAFGPRAPGLASHDTCRDWLVESLKPLADSVERQDFSRSLDGKNRLMSNVIARWKPRAATAASSTDMGVLLCGHWDTRPWADQERNAADRRKPIPGANDGASEIAALLEMARAFKQSPPPVPVMIVFFDGEDYGPGIDRMFLGSRYFANNLPKDTPRQGVLLDMIGDRDLAIPQEAHSATHARDVVDQIYATARKLGYGANFPVYVYGAIEDDHIPLIEKHLQVADLIDFSYGPNHSWWHTLADTPDKCSPNSLKVVGDVILEWVYSRK